MKKSTLLLAVLTLVSGSAFATKARMAALSNAAYLTTDTQSIFDNIARITQIGDYATFEMGPSAVRSLGTNTLDSDFNVISQQPGLYDTATGAAPVIYGADAEGGFVTSHGDNKFGFYFGRKSQFTTLARSIGGFLGQENTIEAMYGLKAGDLSWGVSVNYSSSNKNSVSQRQSAAGVRFGVVAANWDAFAVTGLASSGDGAVKAGVGSFTPINDPTATYRGTAGYKFGGGYWLNSMYINANYYQDGAKIAYAAAPGGAYAAGGFLLQTNNVEQKHWEVGVIDTVKNGNSTFFYGGYYAADNAQNKENPTDSADPYRLDKTSLPLLMGIEVQANSWLTVLASVKQNVILGTKKAQGADSDTIVSNTTAAAGVGMKWDKVSVDATIAKASNNTTSDNINAGNLFSNASLTYLF